MTAAPAQYQSHLQRVGQHDDGAAFVQQLVGNALLRDFLDFAEHAHGIAGALVFFRTGDGLAGEQRGRQHENQAWHAGFQGGVQDRHGGTPRRVQAKVMGQEDALTS